MKSAMKVNGDLKNERDLNIFLVISYIKNNQRKNREYKGRKKINNEMINKKI